MEAVECGAASLAMILGHHGRHVPLEELRLACNVTRDGTNAVNLLKAARAYGLTAKGYKKETADLKEFPLPAIIFWNFNHFLVFEGWNRQGAFLNDPASGARHVDWEEFERSYTGVALMFEPEENFERRDDRPGFAGSLRQRLRGSELALIYVTLATAGLMLPGLVLPAVTRLYIDEVLVRGDPNWLRPIIAGCVAAAAGAGLLTWLQQRYLARLEVKFALTMAARFLWHLLHLPMAFFSQRYASDLSGRMGLNERVAALLSAELATRVFQLGLLVVYAAILFTYDVPLALIGVAVAAIQAGTAYFVAGRLRDLNNKQLAEAEKASSTGLTGLMMIETLKSCGGESDFFQRWAGYHARLLNSANHCEYAAKILLSLTNLVAATGAVLVLVVGGFRVMDGALTIGALVAFQTLLVAFLAPVRSLVELGSSLQEAGGDLGRLDDVLRAETEKVSLLPEAIGSEPPGPFTGRLELRQVTFGYNRNAEPLLRDFNLVLEPGKRVALVGGSDSGKSTVARLVAGMMPPWEGEILFDGRPRESWPRAVMTQSVAMVDHEVMMFEGTLRENLALWDSTLPDEQILAAARDACILEAINERPEGLDGRLAEGGMNFSGGQRQRLEIARALALNPALLILDDATSALDPITEQLINQQLRARGCSCLIIAHRLSTIREADEIIVLHRGEIVERGRHEDLILTGGPYAQLVSEETEAVVG